MFNLEDVYNFKPDSEVEKTFFETHSALSKATSRMIRGLPPEERLNALRISNPSDLSLMALYLWALRQEDYETCSPVKSLLLERGIKIPE